MDSSASICLAYLTNDLNNEYSTGICRGALHAAKELGVSIVMFGIGTLGNTVPDAGMRNSLMSVVNPDDFDAIVYTSGSLANTVGAKRFLEATAHFGDIPSVHIGVETPDHMCFTIDNRKAMYQMTDHMIKAHGRRKIAFIHGARGGQESDARFDGYRQALQENDIPYDDRYVYEGYFLRERGIQAIREYLDVQRIELDAVVASSDSMALYALKELQRRGYRVPEDVCVSGFDDTTVAQSYSPALTTVHQPLGKLGYVSVKLLVDRLRKGSYESSSHQMDARLVPRESCGCSAGRTDFGEIESGIQADIDREFWMSYSEKAETDVNLHAMSRAIIGTFNEEEIRSALDVSLKMFEIEHFSLAKYLDNKRAVVFYSMDGDRGQEFAARKLVHTGIQSIPRPFTRFVLPLHFRNENIGFFVSDKGSKDISVLEVMRDHISGALKGAALLKDVHAYAASLEEMVQERTAELERALEKVRAVSEKLEKLAVMDELTGLYNRRGFLSVAGKQIERVHSVPQDILLVFMDMDGLKHINDTYGHEAGDQAIRAVAEILTRVFRKSDIVARFGGDEFTVLAVDCSTAEYVRISRRIDEYVKEYNETSGNDFTLSVTHGAAAYEEDSGATLEDLMREADSKLYGVKRTKKDRRRRTRK